MIKPNIALWITSEPSPESLQIVYSLLAGSYLLYISIKRTWTWNQAKIWGVRQGSSQKSRGAWTTQAPLEPPLGPVDPGHADIRRVKL